MNPLLSILVTIGGVGGFMLVFALGFIAGMRHEFDLRHERGIPDAQRWDAAADLRDSRDCRKNSAGIYSSKWNQV